jgi:RNA polymerase sigma-32 factor
MSALAQTAQLPVLSTGSLQSYLDSIQQIPILSAEEEAELFRRFQTEDDLEAARKLVLSHLRYVVYVARGYNGYGLPLEDIIQQGNVGLMKSVKKFDLSHGVRLVSFAVHWIKAEIHEYILKNWKIVKVATTKAQRKLFFNLRKSKARLGWFSQEEVEQVANDLGVKPAEVLEMEARLANVDESFEPLYAEDDEFIASPSGYLTHGDDENPAELVADAELESRQMSGLEAALASLDDRARDIVVSRWLQDEKMSLKDLAARYEVSIERIRQIEARSFKLMQPYLEDDLSLLQAA